ncbi:MAG TPA: alpha/beta fold hydrolase, partial [Polyangiaceae bacterium]
MQPSPVVSAGPVVREALRGYQSSAREITWRRAERGQELAIRQHRVLTGDPLVALLCRYGTSAPSAGREPVLLLHGASAWSGTFLLPNGGVVRHLLRDFDVWTLDWRCSKIITDAWLSESMAHVPEAILRQTLEDVARLELPAAAAQITEVTGRLPHVVGHCMGAAAAALAAAEGAIGAPRRFGGEPRAGIASLVLATIGLFFRGGVDTWLRAQERLDAVPQPTWYLSPSAERWPEDYEEVYELWSKTPYPHCERSFCRRISSLLGAPYRPDDIAYLHDDDERGLPSQFGAMPLSFLGHCARSVRRGFPPGSYTPESFAGLRVQLLTGNENQLWHRDSIDRMYDWLRRDPRVRVTKRVFERYGHQDLWWSPRSAEPG